MEENARGHTPLELHIIDCVRRGVDADCSAFAAPAPQGAPEPALDSGPTQAEAALAIEGPSSDVAIAEPGLDAPPVEIGAPADADADAPPAPIAQAMTKREGLAQVSGKFLADLCLGAIEGVVVHPFGIRLLHAEVPDRVNLGKAKRTLAGGDLLPSLSFGQCVLRGLTLTDTRIAGLALLDCEVGGIDATGAEILGSVVIAGGQAGELEFDDARIEGSLMIGGNSRTRAWLSIDGLSTRGMEVRGDMSLWRVETASAETAPGNLLGSNLRVRGILRLRECRMRKPVALDGLKAAEMELLGCWLAGDARNPALILIACEVETYCFLSNVRFSGDIHMIFSKFGSRLWLRRVVARAGSNPSLYLMLAEIGQGLVIEQSHLGNADMQGAQVKGAIEISRSRVESLVAQRCEASNLAIHRLRCASIVDFEGAKINGGVDIHQLVAARRPANPLFPDPDLLPQLGLDFSRSEIRGLLILADSLIHGQFAMQGMKTNAGLQVRGSWLLSRRDLASIRMENVDAAGIVSFDGSAFSCGLSMPMFACSELQFNACHIGSGDGGRAGNAIWASDCRIQRRVTFNRLGEAECDILGEINFFNSQLGESIYIRSMQARLSATAEVESARLFNLGRCRIEGSVFLCDNALLTKDETGREECPARLTGCVVLDDARINGHVVLHRTVIRAPGGERKITGRAGDESDVSKRHRGVALSLRRARIGGDVDVGNPTLREIVDLRDAEIDRVADGSGGRWALAGVEPGQLLLDGLVYRDLDDVRDLRTGKWWQVTRLWRNKVVPRSEIAKLRLQWLAMQFPGERPNASLFVPQPYEQLAKAFGTEGNERARREVLRTKRDFQRRYGGTNWLERLVGKVIRITSDYGYNPGKAILWLVALIGLGTWGATELFAHGLILRASTDTDKNTWFDPLLFAIDSALPIIDLHQDGVFIVDPIALRDHPELRPALVVAKGVYDLIGLALASITVLTLTGVLREKE